MERIINSPSGFNSIKESFYGVLNEISEITPKSTFSKENEKDFLKDAIVMFEYLKSGINIRTSEIFINSGENPLYYLEKMLSESSKKDHKEPAKPYKTHLYKTPDGKLVKIYERDRQENKKPSLKSKGGLNNAPTIERRKFLLISSLFSENSKVDTMLELKKLVDYARENGLILIYDVSLKKGDKRSENIRSIYEIENAMNVAIEFRKLSFRDNNEKLSCGYMVVPDSLNFPNLRKEVPLFNVKNFLNEETNKEFVSRQALERSFSYYTCQ